MRFDLTREQRIILRIVLRMKSSGFPFNPHLFYTLYAEKMYKKASGQSANSLAPSFVEYDYPIDFEKVLSACNSLLAKGYFEEIKMECDSKESQLISDITLSYRGMTYSEQVQLSIYRFLVGSVLVPILLSLITNLLLQAI